MRIALLSEYPLGRDRVVGGLEALARELSRGLASRDDVEVHVLSFHGGLATATRETVEGVQIHRFALPARWGNVTGGAAERRATRQRLREIRPDVVHALGLGPKSLAAADSGFPWVVTVNGIQSNEARTTGGWKNRVRAAVLGGMENAGMRRATDIVVPNERVGEMLRGRTGSARVHVLENPVDASFFDLRPAGDPSRVVCVGRLLPLKAPEDLIEAARRLAIEGVGVRVRFVGPAEDRWYLEGLKERVRSAHLGTSVEFLGFVSDEDLRSEMAAAGVLAHPSRVEVAPLSVMQAMAAGLPVVATDVGGTGRLVDPGRTGLLVPPGEPARLARALAQLRADPPRARRMGVAARAEAERRFRLEGHLDRALDLYREVSARSFDSTGSRRRNALEFRGITHNSGIRKGTP